MLYTLSLSLPSSSPCIGNQGINLKRLSFCPERADELPLFITVSGD